jgi:hypothetical protein
MGIAAVCLGVVALCAVFFGFLHPLAAFAAVPCAILAIVFGHSGDNTEASGMAMAGRVTGYLALVLPFVFAGILFYLADQARQERLRRDIEDNERMFQLERRERERTNDLRKMNQQYIDQAIKGAKVK